MKIVAEAAHDLFNTITAIRDIHLSASEAKENATRAGDAVGIAVYF